VGDVHIDARPSPVRIDPATTAVMVVDMQHDFASAGGMFDRAGIDISPVQKIIEPTRSLLEAARTAGLTICYLKMAFRDDLSDAGHPHSPTWIKHIPMNVGASVESPNGQLSRILIRDTWNTDIIPELTPHPGDMVVYKHRYSGFYGTELEPELRRRGIETIIFVGATTSVCVESTVRDAMARDFHCIVVEDCVAEPIGADLERSNHDASLLTLQVLFASISSSESLTSGLSSLS
jgi:ureidoacrylate peracid hydrolase